jgi:hypothetical protein
MTSDSPGATAADRSIVRSQVVECPDYPDENHVVVSSQNSQVVAGLLRVSLCSVVLGGAKCNGRHAEFANEIKA